MLKTPNLFEEFVINADQKILIYYLMEMYILLREHKCNFFKYNAKFVKYK